MQSQIGEFARFLVARSSEQTGLPGAVACGLLDADFLGIGDDDVEAAAVNDGDGFVAVAGERELEAGRECFVHTWRQDPLVRHVGQFTQRAENGFTGGEDERVLHERAVRVVLRHCKFGGDDGAHQDGLACAHCEREDVARVVERERFAQ